MWTASGRPLRTLREQALHEKMLLGTGLSAQPVVVHSGSLKKRSPHLLFDESVLQYGDFLKREP